MPYPSANQCDAVEFLFNALHNDKPVSVLSGPGGAGKTEIAKELVQEYYPCQKQTIRFAATTNKAASRLSESVNKGRDKETLIEVKTVHSLVSKPVFKQCYVQLEKFFEDKLSIDDFSLSTVTFLDKHDCDAEEIIQDYSSIHAFLKGINVDSFSPEVFDRFAIAEPQTGVIVIDEASMLPAKALYKDGSLTTIGLNVVQMVFSKVILLGDVAQLPPVNGSSSFDGLPIFELTENFRTMGSNIDRIINAARDGEDLRKFVPNKDEPNIRVYSALNDKWYINCLDKTNVVHIVYKNKTRKNTTRRIRGKRTVAQIGEPVVYMGFSDDSVAKGEIGFVNKSRAIQFFNGNTKRLYPNFDEYSDQYSIQRFGYVLTAHMSQGSQWDHVIVHVNDIPHFIDEKTRRQWIYTSVSRASKSITIVA